MPRFFAARFWSNTVGLGGTAPAVPTLSFTDNANGTGAVATVAGSDVGTTNTVYTMAFNGDLGTSTWTSKGSRSGNGTVSVSITTAGHYFGYVNSLGTGGTSSSTPIYFVVTDGVASTHYRCLLAVQSVIQSLTLSGISSGSVVLRKLPIDRGLGTGGTAFPAVLVTPQREIMNPLAGTTARDDVVYGVMVTFLDADNQESTLVANLSRDMLWRQRVAKAIRSQRLSGVSEILTASVEPVDVVVPEAWQKNLLASALLCKFTSREPRGLT